MDGAYAFNLWKAQWRTADAARSPSLYIDSGRVLGFGPADVIRWWDIAVMCTDVKQSERLKPYSYRSGCPDSPC